jgi:hypothetical protein
LKKNVNCYMDNTISRGPIVNEEDLLAALNEGQIAGAALDVLNQEPPQQTIPWSTTPRLLSRPTPPGSPGNPLMPLAVPWQTTSRGSKREKPCRIWPPIKG